MWVYRWWEKDISGKPVRRKLQIGGVDEYSTESSAQAVADAIRLTVNNHSTREILNKTTVSTLWEHYCREALPLKEMSKMLTSNMRKTGSCPDGEIFF